MPNPSRPRFLHGAFFSHDVPFSEGTVVVRGIVGVDRVGRQLLLWDVDVFPAQGGRLVIGLGGALRLFRELCRLAAAEGFETLVVSGYRVSGANPGRVAEVAFDCRPRRPDQSPTSSRRASR